MAKLKWLAVYMLGYFPQAFLSPKIKFVWNIIVYVIKDEDKKFTSHNTVYEVQEICVLEFN